MPPDEPIWSCATKVRCHDATANTTVRPRLQRNPSRTRMERDYTCSRRPWQSAFGHDAYPDIHMKAGGAEAVRD
jgi:hypothetical protein